MAPTVLIVTEPTDVHSDAVVRELGRRDVPVFRLHTQDFPRDIAVSIEIVADGVRGEIVTPHRSVRLGDIGCVWYRRPQAVTLDPSIAPEAVEFAQVQAEQTIRTLCSVLDTPWVTCTPNQLEIAEIKALQLNRARAAGFAIPATLITNSPQRATGFRQSLAMTRCAVKPVAARMVKQQGSFLPPITQILPIDHPLESVALAPLIFEAYVEKSFELRCVVVGREVFPVKIDSQRLENTRIDWRAAWSNELTKDENRYEVYELPEHVTRSIYRLMDSFGIRFASMDLIVSPAGEVVFLDLNPNGQWLWLEKALGLPIASSLAEMLITLSRPAAVSQ